MAVIVVGGSGRGVGKTALVCGLIAALREFRWTAVKITNDAHAGLPPIFEDTIAEETTAEETVAGQGTDTARYLAARAERAFLVTAGDEEFAERLGELGRILDWQFQDARMAGAERHVIFESNRVLSYIEPDLCLLVRGAPGESAVKPSFQRAARFADAMAVEGGEDAVFFDPFNASGREPMPIFHLKALDCISATMRLWVRQQLGLTT